MSEHTPGPWFIYDERDFYPGIETRLLSGLTFSIVVYGCEDELEGVQGRTHDEALANARLIAAAPELLGELKAQIELAERVYIALRQVAPGGMVEDIIDMIAPYTRSAAREAIAKAEGR